MEKVTSEEELRRIFPHYTKEEIEEAAAGIRGYVAIVTKYMAIQSGDLERASAITAPVMGRGPRPYSSNRRLYSCEMCRVTLLDRTAHYHNVRVRRAQ